MADPGGIEDPQEARSAIDSILSDPEFSDLERHWYSPIVDFLTDPFGALGLLIDWVLYQVASASSIPWVAALIGFTFLLFVVVGVVTLTRSVGNDPGAPVHVDLSPNAKSAEDHDVDADSFERKGEFASAVRSRFSALLLRLARQGVLELRPGRTTGEYRAELQVKAPNAAGPFGQAVEIFDRIWFGGHVATVEDSKTFKTLSLDVLKRTGRAVEATKSGHDGRLDGIDQRSGREVAL